MRETLTGLLLQESAWHARAWIEQTKVKLPVLLLHRALNCYGASCALAWDTQRLGVRTKHCSALIVRCRYVHDIVLEVCMCSSC